jgi:hypothetical protein
MPDCEKISTAGDSGPPESSGLLSLLLLPPSGHVTWHRCCAAMVESRPWRKESLVLASAHAVLDSLPWERRRVPPPRSRCASGPASSASRPAPPDAAAATARSGSSPPSSRSPRPPSAASRSSQTHRYAVSPHHAQLNQTNVWSWEIRALSV